MNVITCAVLAALRLLIFVVQIWIWNQGMSGAFTPRESENGEVLHGDVLKLNSSEIAQGERVRELISAWCSAYSQLDSKQMASLEAEGAEIVDAFGDAHYPSSRDDREHFWAEGFEIIEPREFHPEQTFQHIQLPSSHMAVVQVKVTYPHGIRLKGREFIPPYSEVHTFIVTNNQHRWLIAGHIFVRQELPRTLTGDRQGSTEHRER